MHGHVVALFDFQDDISEHDCTCIQRKTFGVWYKRMLPVVLFVSVDSSAENGFVVTENTELMGKKAASGAGDLTLSPTGSGLPGNGYRDFDSRSTSSLGVIARPTTRSSTSYTGYERLPVQRHQIQLISLLGQYRAFAFSAAFGTWVVSRYFLKAVARQNFTLVIFAAMYKLQRHIY